MDAREVVTLEYGMNLVSCSSYSHLVGGVLEGDKNTRIGD